MKKGKLNREEVRLLEGTTRLCPEDNFKETQPIRISTMEIKTIKDLLKSSQMVNLKLEGSFMGNQIIQETIMIKVHRKNLKISDKQITNSCLTEDLKTSALTIIIMFPQNLKKMSKLDRKDNLKLAEVNSKETQATRLSTSVLLAKGRIK